MSFDLLDAYGAIAMVLRVPGPQKATHKNKEKTTLLSRPPFFLILTRVVLLFGGLLGSPNPLKNTCFLVFFLESLGTHPAPPQQGILHERGCAGAL